MYDVEVGASGGEGGDLCGVGIGGPDFWVVGVQMVLSRA